MEIWPNSFTILDLTIATPGLFSSPSIPSGENVGSDQMKKSGMNNKVLLTSEEGTELVEDEEEEDHGSSGPGKKLRLTKQQSHLLEESFKQNHNLNPKQKDALAMQLRLKRRQVEVWFQNRRARSKLKQKEVECEHLKRMFGSLVEQNRRLQTEVANLKLARPSAATIIMCPRCERVDGESTTAPPPQSSNFFQRPNIN